MAAPAVIVAQRPTSASGNRDHAHYGFISSSGTAEGGPHNTEEDDVNQAASYDDINQGTPDGSNKSLFEVTSHLLDSEIA